MDVKEIFIVTADCNGGVMIRKIEDVLTGSAESCRKFLQLTESVHNTGTGSRLRLKLKVRPLIPKYRN